MSALFEDNEGAIQTPNPAKQQVQIIRLLLWIVYVGVLVYLVGFSPVKTANPRFFIFWVLVGVVYFSIETNLYRHLQLLGLFPDMKFLFVQWDGTFREGWFYLLLC